MIRVTHGTFVALGVGIALVAAADARASALTFEVTLPRVVPPATRIPLTSAVALVVAEVSP